MLAFLRRETTARYWSSRFHHPAEEWFTGSGHPDPERGTPEHQRGDEPGDAGIRLRAIEREADIAGQLGDQKRPDQREQSESEYHREKADGQHPGKREIQPWIQGID